MGIEPFRRTPLPIATHTKAAEDHKTAANAHETAAQLHTKGQHTEALETATQAKGGSVAASKSSADTHAKSTTHAKK